MVMSTGIYLEFLDELLSNGIGEEVKNAAHLCDIGEYIIDNFDSCFNPDDSMWKEFLDDGNMWVFVNEGFDDKSQNEIQLTQDVGREFERFASGLSDHELRHKLPVLRKELEDGLLSDRLQTYQSECDSVADRLLAKVRAELA